MADPLSITASIAALLQLVDSVAKGVRKFARYKSASLFLQQLNNELSDLRLVIGRIDDVCLQASNEISASAFNRESLYRAIHGGKKTILGLERVISGGLLMPSDGADSKIDRLFWMRKESELRDMLNDLRFAKLSISLAIGVDIMYVFPKRVSFECIILRRAGGNRK